MFAEFCHERQVEWIEGKEAMQKKKMAAMIHDGLPPSALQLKFPLQTKGCIQEHKAFGTFHTSSQNYIKQ